MADEVTPTPADRPEPEGSFREADEGGRTRSSQLWLELGLVVGFWVVIFVITVIPQILDLRRGRVPETWFLYQEGLEYLVWMILTPAIFWLARHYNLEREDWRRLVGLHILVAVGVAFFTQYYGYLTFISLRPAAAPDPEFSFWPPLALFGFRAIDELLIYLAILATGFGRDYFLRYQERREEAARLRTQAAEIETQLAEARLDALRIQIIRTSYSTPSTRSRRS